MIQIESMDLWTNIFQYSFSSRSEFICSSFLDQANFVTSAKGKFSFSPCSELILFSMDGNYMECLCVYVCMCAYGELNWNH